VEYLVTGASGLVGRFLLERLLAREGATVHAVVRDSGMDHFEQLRERYAALPGRLEVLEGDVTRADVIAAAELERLRGRIDHVFHLAAAYDMDLDDATADLVNIEGTRYVVALARALGQPVLLHHLSSLGAAGDAHVGEFSEDTPDAGRMPRHPYYRSTLEAERVVRQQSAVPYRIYRPGLVVGSSVDGEMDRVDGPYYFFKTIQKLSQRLPKWLPLLRLEGGQVPVVPVDYVATALDVLSHMDGLDGQNFHLMQPDPPTVGDLMQLLLEAAYGPESAGRLDLTRIPMPARAIGAGMLQRLSTQTRNRLARGVGVPLPALSYVLNRTRFDDRVARTLLRDCGVHCPDIRDYAGRLWEYWELYLDRPARISVRARRQLDGKTVLVTGASSGIGFHSARQLAAAGARVILVARNEDKLRLTRKVIEKAGGEAYEYSCDLSDLAAIDRLAEQVLREQLHIDVLINNAGHSIRRGVMERGTRFKDFERTMQLNYFGAVRLTMRLLPSMIERRSGHIVNISSIGVLANAARFSAYVASKAALDAFTRCLSAEVHGHNIRTTAIYMPLVRTPMIAPTKVYDYVPTWSPHDAAEAVLKAVVERPKSIATPLGTAAAVSYALWPKVNDYVLSKGYQLFPPSSAARGRKDGARPTVEQTLFAHVFKGEYW
jgi:NAD(P)-dependent dehydrogenase (short-subunit alcohol dehydrogenase family)